MMANSTASAKKILIFSPYYPPHIGGVENYTEELANQLVKNNLQLTIFTPRIPKDAPQQEKKNGVEVLRFPAFEIITNFPVPKFWSKDYRELQKKISQENFDIIISQTRFFLTSILAKKFAKKMKVHWIHIEHGSDFVQNNILVSKIAWCFDMTLGKFILMKARVVAISEAAKVFVQSLVPDKDCTVIYRGYDSSKLENIGKNIELQKKYSDKTIITYIGRLISGKGVSDLIQAASQIKNDGVVYFIVGDGQERSNLEKKAHELGLSEEIIFFGYKKFEDTVGILKISDILVNPSYTEGLPTVVLEAALCRKAVVATNVGGTSEIIEHEKSGLLVKPRDIAGLKNALEKLLADPELRNAYSSLAFLTASQKFKWDLAVEKFQELFNII